MKEAMKRSDVLKALAERRAEWEKYDVDSLSLFGSFARDEATDASDLDVLVEFKHAPTFDGYMGLKFYLEDLFGRRVDVVTRDGLRPRMRALVEREALRVA
jgi:predicted nucleotidyltransferase